MAQAIYLPFCIRIFVYKFHGALCIWMETKDSIRTNVANKDAGLIMDLKICISEMQNIILEFYFLQLVSKNYKLHIRPTHANCSYTHPSY